MSQVKTHLEMMQDAFGDWLRELDGHLHDAELSFEEFSGAGKMGDLATAGEALARAEISVKKVRAQIAHGLKDNFTGGQP